MPYGVDGILLYRQNFSETQVGNKRVVILIGKEWSNVCFTNVLAMFSMSITVPSLY